ncbi:MAG: pentapeptide repeat-containing protein [Candidatus Omnitrophota bacterium]|nr:pentapeptide repeat-containing protein [Candidatus Omnitrophota bacterium]
MSTCQIKNKYSWINCNLPSLEQDNEGLCLLHSQNINKNQDAFRELIERKFEAKDYDFQGGFSPCKVELNHQTISNNLNFEWATFLEPLSIIRTIFISYVNFYAVTFYKNVYFWGVTFYERADFGGATFKGEAQFPGTTFYGIANFTGTTFERNVTFYASTFKREAFFDKSNFNDEGDLCSIMVESETKITFQDLSLSKVLLAETDVRKIVFHHVDWHHLRRFSWLPCRPAVYDEVKLNKEGLSFWDRLSCCIPIVGYALEIEKDINAMLIEQSSLFQIEKAIQNDFAKAEELYRYLKLNYEEKGDLKQSGDFHYGEMEMYRKSHLGRRSFSWISFYWLLSGYGERPSWALGWLGVFIAGMAGLVWGLGLKVGNPSDLAGFGDSFIYLLQKATLQRPDWADPVGFGGKIVAGFSVLLIPGQAALFLLALRNRLGRRR